MPAGARAAIVLGVSFAYLASVFDVAAAHFWTTGLGDWRDPYFINALLEHWYRSLVTLSDPSSPPMFHPAEGTLGYSHGLVLFAPFYAAVRPFLHPFQAYTVALWLVIHVGIVCLYVLLRRFLALTFLEACVLTAFFVTSRNVLNGELGVWSQRASVFLLPILMLLAFEGWRRRDRRTGGILLAVASFASLLMFVQDVYTALFCVLFLALLLLAAWSAGQVALPRLSTAHAAVASRTARIALAIAVLAFAWMLLTAISGGGSIEIGGLRISSRNARRPALVGLIALAVFAWTLGAERLRAALRSVGSPFRWLLAGGFAGAAVFLWMYLPAYMQYSSFPREELLAQLVERDLRHAIVYDGIRSFLLATILAVIAWIPLAGVDRVMRIYLAWLLVAVAIVIIVPLRFGGFGPWPALVGSFPGFAAIRDPRRIVYVYELAAVGVFALFLARLRRASVLRWVVTVGIAVLLVAERNATTFWYARPNADFDRWVSQPIQQDAACRSFFVTAAGDDYRSRSLDAYSLYGVDATFIALQQKIPTLNGFSAWGPPSWEMHDPHAPRYREVTDRWIAQHQLTGVCTLNIERRVFRPYE